MTIGVILTLVLLLVYVAFRIWRGRTQVSRYLSNMPPSNRLSWVGSDKLQIASQRSIREEVVECNAAVDLTDWNVTVGPREPDRNREMRRVRHV